MELPVKDKFYVYIHSKLDSREVFYVGKGSGNRAYCNKRNTYWHNIVNKHGYTVDILEYFKTSKEACKREFELISFYKSKGLAQANILPGGEDNSGENNPMYGKGHLLRGDKNGMYGKIGKMSGRFKENHPKFNVKESEETKLKKSISHLGSKHPKHRWIYITPSGMFESVTEAAEHNKTTVPTVKSRCRSGRFHGWSRSEKHGT